ncbi:hypothetical protein EJB05_48823 [Eragrostis curvula]|uniref:Uncharacterized protein n=1 Tax=Eragrostis curvula TaxID=38414 RepID=A0A5J9T2X4_9POAL|nr:hypothetical protein EJB05_48823 [Eragrostis curvula]
MSRIGIRMLIGLKEKYMQRAAHKRSVSSISTGVVRGSASLVRNVRIEVVIIVLRFSSIV